MTKSTKTGNLFKPLLACIRFIFSFVIGIGAAWQLLPYAAQAGQVEKNALLNEFLVWHEVDLEFEQASASSEEEEFFDSLKQKYGDTTEVYEVAIALQGSDRIFEEILAGIERGVHSEALLCYLLQFGHSVNQGGSQFDWEKAMSIAELGVSFNPDNSFFHYIRAMLFAESGDYTRFMESIRDGNSAVQNYLPQGHLTISVLAMPDSFIDWKSKATASIILIRSNVPPYFSDGSGPYGAINPGIFGSAHRSFYDDSLFSPADAEDYLEFCRRLCQMENQPAAGILLGLLFARVHVEALQIAFGDKQGFNNNAVIEFLVQKAALEDTVSKNAADFPDDGMAYLRSGQAFDALFREWELTKELQAESVFFVLSPFAAMMKS